MTVRHPRYVRATNRLLERAFRLPVLGARLASQERSLVPEGPCRVLFLCKGNICRSVFGERIARILAGDEPGWEFRSAGLEASPGTAPPELAVRVAAEFGVDLASHRSRSATPEDLSGADVVFVMEPWQRSLARRLAGPACPAVALLGALCREGGRPPVIQDPFGRDAAAHRLTFDQIRDAVVAILDRAGRNGRRT